MTRDEKKILKLMQYGIDSELAERLVSHGYGVSKLRVTNLAELSALVGDEKARKVKKFISRTPISDDTLQRLIKECDWSCCFCWNLDNRQPVVVHHIEPYEKTQDHSYDNLVVVCPNHHAEAHSKSDLTGKLLPAELIKQNKLVFIEAIRQAKAGKRAFPGREPFTHYSWEEILKNSQRQVASSLISYSNTYDVDLYVKRGIEDAFWRFVEADKTGFLVVDKSGQGKSNLVCSLASQLLAKEKVVTIIRGDVNLVDDNDLERSFCKSLGYDPSNYHTHIDAVAQTLKSQNEVCHIILDGISECNSLSTANRALLNLLTNVAQFGCFKLCVTCRDTEWYRIGYDLPSDLFFEAKEKTSEYEDVGLKHFVQPLTDEELDRCLSLYQDKYEVEFTPSPAARNQLKHPLMLRMFCEAYRGEVLGQVSNVPVVNTFDLFLSKKLRAIENRLDYKFKFSLLLKILRIVALELWNLNDTKALDETQWYHSLPASVANDHELILREFESEGILEIQEDEITLERRLRIVFDQLREYLLLQHLLTLFPSSIIQSCVDKENFETLLFYVKKKTAERNDFKALSLMGMQLPVPRKRRAFLKELLKYDFQTFCSCLSQIPPVGELSKCESEAQYSLAEELREWYELIATNVFREIYNEFDPWVLKSDVKTVGISMQVSPECKEISYQYGAFNDDSEENHLVEVRQTSDYPTFHFSANSGEESFLMHDPENGSMISTFRGGPDGKVNRTINYKFFPRFPGDSFNVPERMALYNIWEEIKEIINKDRLPFQPTRLIAERAWAIASDIPDIVPEGLDINTFQEQASSLVDRFSGQDYESIRIRSQLQKLGVQLSLLSEPLHFDQHPFYKLQSKLQKPPTASDLQDNELREYLFQVIGGAIMAYKSMVKTNFPVLNPVLNTYANMPFKVIIVSDRTDLMYAFQPTQTWEDTQEKLIAAVSVDYSGLSLSDSSLQIKNDDGEKINFEKVVLDSLKEFHRMRPTIHPINTVVSINEFFVKTPMNRFVRTWLLQDLQAVFGL